MYRIMTSIVGAFNNHFVEFLEDVQTIFPNDKQIKTAKSTPMMLKKQIHQQLLRFGKQISLQNISKKL